MRSHRLSLLLVLGAAAAGGRPGPVRPGIEVLLTDSLRLVAGRRVALLTNQTGVDRAGRRDVDLLRATPGVRLVLLFSPEHGVAGREDRPGIPDTTDSATGLPIYSLFGGTPPSAVAALDSVDVVLADLQDVGARYYSYPPTVVLLMEEAARRGKPFVVLDRPDPLGGALVQGNVAVVAHGITRVSDFLAVPMRHGMTIGELTRLANDRLGIGARLSVVPAAGWRRWMYYDQTGLPWVRPSPNMPDLESALLYPGICLFEATNLSVGRGTPTAFQLIGAPWLDPGAVLRRVRRAGGGSGEALAGVTLDTTTFTPSAPTDGKYDGVTVRGVRLRVTDRRRYDATKLAVALLVALRAVHGDSLQFRAPRFDELAGGPGLREALLAGRSPARIWGPWGRALADFRRARAKYLLY